MTLHSSVGASSAERFFNCPGSVREVAKCPPQRESEYALEGTVAHKVAELILHGKKVPDVIRGVAVTQEMLEAVQTYIDVIDDDLAKYKLTRKDLEIERKFALKQIHPKAFGTNDANLAVFMTKCIVYDYKHGSGIAVDAEDNKQGMYYALGASTEGDYEEFEIVIVQPRAIHKKGPVRRWSITRKELDEFARDLKSAILKSEDPQAGLHCGEWCKKTFCPALICCTEARKDMQTAAMVVFDGEVVDNVPPKAETLSPLMIRRLLDMAPIIDTYLKSVETYALDMANRGEKVLGYKLVAKRSNRKWVNEEEVRSTFGEISTRTVVETLSPSQLEGAIKSVKKVTAKQAKELVEPLTFKPDTGNVLVPESDPREESRPKLEQVFADEDLLS